MIKAISEKNSSKYILETAGACNTYPIRYKLAILLLCFKSMYPFSIKFLSG